MDRFLDIKNSINNLARPWNLPPFLLIMLLALNRIVLKVSLDGSPEKHANFILPYFASECFRVFFIAGIFALSIALMLKLVARDERPNASVSDLLALTLKSQAVYLFAAPIALLAISIHPWLSSNIMAQVSQFLKSFFPLAAFVLLFFLLKKHLPNLSEVRVFTLVFSPYLILAATILVITTSLSAAIVFFLIR